MEGLGQDFVRRQYIVKVCSNWRSGRPFGFNRLVEMIAEGYIAASSQLEEVRHTSNSTGDIRGAAVSTPLPMVLRSNWTPLSIFSSPMPTPQMKPTPARVLHGCLISFPLPNLKKNYARILQSADVTNQIQMTAGKLDVVTTVASKDL